MDNWTRRGDRGIHPFQDAPLVHAHRFWLPFWTTPILRMEKAIRILHNLWGYRNADRDRAFTFYRTGLIYPITLLFMVTMAIWSDWLTAASTALEMTTTEAGTFLSLSITIVIVLAILIATKGRKAQYSTTIGAMLSMILFTFMGWMPTWTGSLIAIVLALFIANMVRGGF